MNVLLALGDTNARGVGLPLGSPGATRPYVQSLGWSGHGAGIYAGSNWQFGKFVLGIEGDLSGTAFSAKDTTTSILRPDGTPLAPGSFAFKSEELGALATARLRAGIEALPGLLLYATAGAAYGQVEYSATTFSASSARTYTKSATKWNSGYVFGGGAELALDQRWKLRATYLVYSLGDTSIIADPVPANPPFRARSDFATRGNIINVGLSYYF